MDGNHALYCTVLDKNDKSKLLCYTCKRSGVLNIGLTNASEVWSTDFTEETLTTLRKKCVLKSTEDYILKIRSACATGSVCVSVQDSSAVLHVGSSPGDLSVDLTRLGEPDAKEELRKLLFRMGDSLTQLNSTGSPSVSPLKNTHKRNTEFEPRRHQPSGPSVTKKKRLPGDSLINPGLRRKRPATGVAFDDDDDDDQ
ncbi:protein PAXX isoform X2 [Hypomesus transpacificus]|uniref:protein PAXX isoform X2 n=1 Tax=Hypomesus transpacificus TaxID=137520 RepID=UPI001F07E55A|nr:protein PAXX isoform X2 [Hypomesus transpacificus]